MRYSDEIIEEVRQRNDIVDVIGGYVQLKKKGGNYFGLCPFHNEKSPSFSVTPSKQMYYCFGCGKGGNVITFVMEYENDTFTEALERLAQRVGYELPTQTQDEASKKQMQLRNILLEIQKEAAKFFFVQLKSEKGAIGYEYLKNRGLSDEIIRQFGLGFSLPHKDSLYRYLKKLGYSDAHLKESGLIRLEEQGAYDKFWNRVMFPIMDANSRVVGFGGRVMGDAKPKYLNSPETLIFDKSKNLYGLHAARKTRRSYFLICEGYMDVISLHQAGFTNAVAALGTAFTVHHGMMIKRYTKDVILTFDSDEAGIKAALRAIPLAREAGLHVRVLDMKPYKDPDEFIKQLGAEAYQKRIDAAVNGFLFEIQCLRKEYDCTDPAKKTEFIEQTAIRLRGFRDELEQDSYIQAVAKEHGIDYRMLRMKVLSLPYQTPISQEEKKEVQKTKKREKDEGLREAQRMLLTWVAEEEYAYERLADVITPQDFTDELYKQVAEMLFDQKRKNAVNVASILNHFIGDEGNYQEVAKIFHTGLKGETTKEEKNRAFRECVIRVRKNSLDNAAQKVQDFKELEAIIEQQKALERLHIFLN